MGALSFPTSHVRQEAFSVPIGRQSQVRNLDRVFEKKRPCASQARVTVPFQISAKSSNDERQESSEGASTSSSWTGLVSNLLFGAATSLERGDATCLSCRGTGALPCSACKGAGVMQQKVRMNQLRHTMNRVKTMVGMESKSMYDTQWQMSNRCRKCHGQGQLLCATCNGLGSRGPRAQVIRRSKVVSK
ncbi:hypothetical protein COCOBI_14-2500 [Coccomyxa sp. Obi]|nr:hypothetical protein COCOBI_14-2500 [Coccomyxa sp. Obi]